MTDPLTILRQRLERIKADIEYHSTNLIHSAKMAVKVSEEIYEIENKKH